MSISLEQIVDPEELIRRVNASLDKTDGCWLWTGKPTPTGYGQIRVRLKDGSQRTLTSSRAAYLVFCGPIPDGLSVLHTCSVRLCCNPKHLELGPHARSDEYKQRNGHSGSTPREKVREARRLYAEGMRQKDIVDLLGLRQPQVSYIVRGKRFKWVE